MMINKKNNVAISKKQIDKFLIDYNLNKTKLAKELNVSRSFLTNVINGKRKSKILNAKIQNFIINKKKG